MIRAPALGALAAATFALAACFVDVDASLLDREGAGGTSPDASTPDAFTPDRAPPAITVGVPAGTVLREAASRTVGVAGTVLDALDVQGCLVIEANDVTVRRSRITCDGLYAIKIALGVTGTLIEDVEIIGSTSAAVVYSGYTARRVDLHGFANNGFLLGNDTIVEGCHVHDPVAGNSNSGAHALSGSNIRFERNVVEMNIDSNYALSFNGKNNVISSVVVADNFLDGGGHIVFANAGTTGEAIRISSNRLGRTFRSGPHLLGDGVSWTGNVWADTGAPVP